MTVDTCRCSHSRQAHEIAGLAPQCTQPKCECLRYRGPVAVPPTGIPAQPATMASGSPSRPLTITTATTVPTPGPTAEQLIAAGKRSSLKRVAALAEKIEAELGALADRLREERQATEAKRKRAEEQEAARREIRRLEKQLADAKNRLKTTPTQAAPTGEFRCSDCGKETATQRGLVVHRARLHKAAS